MEIFLKIIRIMRLTCILLFLSAGMMFASESYAQNTFISLNMSGKTVAEVLENIEKKTDLHFFYNGKLVNTNRLVSIDVKDKDVFVVLDLLFKGQNVAYKVVDKDVILTIADANDRNQNKIAINGVVMDENREPVIGASVIEKGTTNGNTTDMDGRFTLQVSPGALIQISYIGYISQEVRIEGSTSLTITLSEDTKTLDEVIVVGYGTIKKKDLTGSVGSVDGEMITSRKTTQLSTALQGAVASVMVTRDNSSPGAQSTIRIRGITTIGDTSPLVIVDGVPVDAIDFVNPNDVENITFLKDAASASIYGSRAAAGVILITTKRADENKLSLGYTFEYGFEKPTKFPKFVSPTRFMEIENELRWNDAGNGENRYPTYAKDLIDNYYSLHAQDPDAYPITDWVDLVLKDRAPRQNHLLTISGGNKLVKTKASFAYDKTEGLYPNKDNQRYTMRLNNDFKINSLIAASLDFNYRRYESYSPIEDPFSSADAISIIPSIFAGLWSDGRYGAARTGGNIYTMLKEGGFNNWYYNQLGGKIALDLTPLDGLTLSAVFAPTFIFNEGKEFRKAVKYYDAKDPSLALGYVARYNTTNLKESRNNNYRLVGQAFANYVKAFDWHNMNIMGGYETYYSYNGSLTAGRDNYTLNSYPYLDIGPLDYRNNSGNADEFAYQSFFGRAMYNFRQRYLFQVNIRRDGSSRFYKDYRWGTFPSVSAGWVLSEESFMEKTRSWMSYLKLRVSWGTLGNERIGNYPYQSSIGFSNILFNQGGKIISSQAAAQSKYAIQDISWETTKSTNIGLDVNFLDNRLRFAGDYFYKTTEDMLLALEIPSYVGYSNPDKNTGKMKTRGYELEVKWSDQIGDVFYSVSANMSDFVSKMGDLGGTEFLGDQVKKQGSQFNEWYGYLSDGIYQTQEDVDNSPKLNNNIKPGDVKYLDVSGPDGVPDGKISPEYDRVLLGGSLPRYMYGGSIQAGYKDVDFSLTFQGVGSQHVRMTTNMVQPLRTDWGNVPEILDGNYWSHYNMAEQNKNVKYPRLTTTNATSNYVMSDFWMFNGKYFRLKNITLGYTLPISLTEKVKMNRVRLYLSATDLFSISKYPSGWDPETGATAYPITSSYLMGIMVNF